MTKLERKINKETDKEEIVIKHLGNGIEEAYGTEYLYINEKKWTLDDLEKICRKLYNYAKQDAIEDLHSEWNVFRSRMEML